MELKIFKNMFKKKLHNQIIQDGKKQATEKTVTKSMKQAQKSQKKNINKLIKSKVFDSVSVFKVLTLINKRGRKVSLKEVPKFLSNHKHRLFYAAKTLHKTTITSNLKTEKLTSKLNHMFLTDPTVHDRLIETKNQEQISASTKKTMFKFYRW